MVTVCPPSRLRRLRPGIRRLSNLLGVFIELQEEALGAAEPPGDLGEGCMPQLV